MPERLAARERPGEDLPERLVEGDDQTDDGHAAAYRIEGFQPIGEVLVTPRRWGEALWTAPDVAWLQESRFYPLEQVIAAIGRPVGIPDHRRFSPESGWFDGRSSAG